MAGLTSDNISVASAQQYGFTKDRDTCVFCKRKTRPPPGDPLAPVFVFFSLVDCRHYVCQPCALVNCDNAGRYIRCPTCHAVSRLAQSGRKRNSHYASRVPIDDGVSSILSYATRRSSSALPNNYMPQKSSIASADRIRKRSSSVQFRPDPTTSIVPLLGDDVPVAASLTTAPEATSPLTHEAVKGLPADPEYVNRKRARDTAVGVEVEKPEMVGLYTIGGSSPPRRRTTGERSRSVPLPPREHKYLMPPIPFAPPPPLMIHTVEEEEEVQKIQEQQMEKEPLPHEHLSPLAEETNPTTLTSLDEEEGGGRTYVVIAEEHRRNAIAKQREIQEKEQLAARGKLDDEFDIRLSPQTPVDASEGQVSVSSDDEVPTVSLNHVQYTETLPSEMVEPLFFQPAGNWATEPLYASDIAPVLQENKGFALDSHAMESEEEIPVEPQEQEKWIVHDNVNTASNGLATMGTLHIPNAFEEREVQERNIIDDTEDLERGRLYSSFKQEEVEISALTMQRLLAERTAQAILEYQSYVSSNCAELMADETRRRAFEEEQEFEVRARLSSDFCAGLQAMDEIELLRSSEQLLVEHKRALILLSSAESNTRMQLEQDALGELARLCYLGALKLEEDRRVLEENEMWQNAKRAAGERRHCIEQILNLEEAEDTGRCRLLRSEKDGRQVVCTHFASSMPFTSTATVTPGSVVPPPFFSIPHSSCSPETTRSFTVSPALAPQQIAALSREEELERLELQLEVREEWHDYKELFDAECHRLKLVEAAVEREQLDSSIREHTLENKQKRLELQEEKGRIELQQRALKWYRRLTEKAEEEHQEIDAVERSLRSIAKKTKRLLHRHFSEAQLALVDEEIYDRGEIETHERRAYRQISRGAAKCEELLHTQLQLKFSPDISGTLFLDAMDAAVREFTTTAVHIAREENVERLALLQAERNQFFSLTQLCGETLLKQSQTEAKQQLDYLHSVLETTTAVGTWNTHCAFLVQEELRSRLDICNDEGRRRAWYSADEQREMFDMIKHDTEQLQLAREVELMRSKLQESLRDESDRRAGIYKEEMCIREVLWNDALRHAAQMQARADERCAEASRREQTLNRMLDDLWQEEDDDRYCIWMAERGARRFLQKQAIERASSIALASRDTSLLAVDERPGHPAAVHGTLQDSSHPQPYGEAFVRHWEAAREEEFREAQQQLQEAEARIAAEAARRTLAEEARRVALVESAARIQEAEEKADARIRQALEEVGRTNFLEKERAALVEAEQRAQLEARLWAAEQALAEAKERAAVGEEERIRRFQEQAMNAIVETREEGRKTTEETRRRLEELEERYALREAAVHAAKAKVKVARQRMKAYEESQQTSPSSTRSSYLLCTSGEAVELQKPLKSGVSVQSVHQPPDFTAAICSTVIRAAIREAVDEIVKATKEAWQISEEAGQRLRVEQLRLHRRQSERDQAAQELINAEHEGTPWSPSSNIDNTANSTAVDLIVNTEADFSGYEEEVNKENTRGVWRVGESAEIAQRHNSTRYHSRNEKVEEKLPPPLPENLSCPQCYRSETTSCASCASQICLYCGPSVPHRACCDSHHLDFVNTRRRHPLNRQEQQRQKEKHRQEVLNEKLLERSPPGVQRQLLSDESNNGEEEEVAKEVRREMERKEKKKKRKEVEELQQQEKRNERRERRQWNETQNNNNNSDANCSSKTASVDSVEEPRTERKCYGAFFVPLDDHAEPRRPKPPTPNNYVPGIHFSTSNMPKAEQRVSPPLRPARKINKHDSSATFAAAARFVHEAQQRRSTAAPQERVDPFGNRQQELNPHHGQDYQEYRKQQQQLRQRVPPCMSASTMPVKEPALGHFNSKPCGRTLERRTVQDPLRTSARVSSPRSWKRHAPPRVVDHALPREQFIGFDEEFDDYALRDLTGLARTYYDGKPVRSDGLNFGYDEFVESTSRSFLHQQQYKTTTAKPKKEVEHVNVSRERVPAAAFPNVFAAAPAHELRNKVRERDTPTLQELDERLRHLQQHRVFDRIDRRSPDIHCMRHHYHYNVDVTTGMYDGYDYSNREGDRNRQTGVKSSRMRHVSPYVHEPCITVHLPPRSGSMPRPLTPSGAEIVRGASRPKSRGPSRRTARRATPRVVSPPWRTDYNSSPLRPPWNVEQPRSFIAKPYKRTLLRNDHW